MALFRLRVYWGMMGILDITAEDTQEAVDIAYSYEVPLPQDGTYVEGTFEIEKVEEVVS